MKNLLKQIKKASQVLRSIKKAQRQTTFLKATLQSIPSSHFDLNQLYNSLAVKRKEIEEYLSNKIISLIRLSYPNLDIKNLERVDYISSHDFRSTVLLIKNENSFVKINLEDGTVLITEEIEEF